MLPAWERHDFAEYAAQLPGVRRRRLLAWIFAGLTVLSFGLMPLLQALGVPEPIAFAFSYVSVLFAIIAGLCAVTVGMVQREAIARWMGAAEHTHSDAELQAGMQRTRREQLWGGIALGVIFVALGVWQLVTGSTNPTAWVLAVGGVVLVIVTLIWDVVQARSAARLQPRTAGVTRQ